MNDQSLLVIAGTGKLAQNIGLFFHRSGWKVCWLTRQLERVESAKVEIIRLIRRSRTSFGDDQEPPSWQVMKLSDYRNAADLIIEATVEKLEIKQAIARELSLIGNSNTLRLSNSSSILPSEIGAAWLGCHFFYPVELTGFVELILPAAASQAQQQVVLECLGSLKLKAIIQDEQRAFVVNRLLLPLQTKAIACLMAGQAAAQVESNSVTSMFPRGMLSLMDSIGLDIVLAAVENYARREQGQWDGLIAGLATLVKAGKRGLRNGDGFLLGESLPWLCHPDVVVGSCQKDFEELAISSVCSMLERSEISLHDLQFVLSEYWDAQLDLSGLLLARKIAKELS